MFTNRILFDFYSVGEFSCFMLNDVRRTRQKEERSDDDYTLKIADDGSETPFGAF
jgi:hypothetical protein